MARGPPSFAAELSWPNGTSRIIATLPSFVDQQDISADIGRTHFLVNENDGLHWLDLDGKTGLITRTRYKYAIW
jgi:hypothetical protein